MYLVRRYNILTTKTWVHEVLEVDTDDDHGTIMHIPASQLAGFDTFGAEVGIDVRMGKLGTRRIPREIDAIPAMTHERVMAVAAWYNIQRALAWTIIMTAFPELRERGTKDDMAEIVVFED